MHTFKYVKGDGLISACWSHLLTICRGIISDGNLVVQGPKIINDTNTEQAKGKQINNARKSFAEVHTMDAQKTQERQQNPYDRVIILTTVEAQIRFTIH